MLRGTLNEGINTATGSENSLSFKIVTSKAKMQSFCAEFHHHIRIVIMYAGALKPKQPSPIENQCTMGAQYCRILKITDGKGTQLRKHRRSFVGALI